MRQGDREGRSEGRERRRGMSRVEEEVYNIMEELRQQQWFCGEEGEHTLLSHQMRKIDSYATTTSLIDSIRTADSPPPSLPSLTNFLFPILSLTASIHLPASPTSPTSPQLIKRLKSDLAGDASKSSSKKKAEKRRSSPGKGLREKTFRFLRVVQRERRRDRLLFEESVVSLKEVSGEGYIFLQGGRVLEGEFVEGVAVGPLRIRFENGMLYYGPAYNYRPHGIGEITLPNGERFAGEFCYGEPHGQGVHYHRDGSVKREGEWRRGKFQP